MERLTRDLKPEIESPSMKTKSQAVRFPLSFVFLLTFWLAHAGVATIGLAQESGDEAASIALWPNGLPADAKPLSDQQIEKAQSQTTAERIAYVESPSLAVFPVATESKTEAQTKAPAVIICPGGGYVRLAWIKEGTKVAQWWNSIGVHAFVLQYRVPRRDPDRIHWEPMQDVQRAIRLVRSNAQQYNIDVDKVGVLGFSAGGHLSVMAGTQFNTDSYPAVDAADQLSCRPDFICPIYAAYLGNNYKDNVAELGDLVQVNEQTPATFMAVTADDKQRGAQAALLFAKLCENKVPAELHVWQTGGHGYGMEKRDKQSDGWEKHLQAWLKLNQLLPNQ